MDATDRERWDRTTVPTIVNLVRAGPAQALLLVGLQGTGRSSVLGGVAAELRAMGRPVVLMSLRRVRNDHELLTKITKALNQQLIPRADQEELSDLRIDLRRDTASSDSVLKLPDDVVLIFEGLDEADRPLPIMGLLSHLAKESPATVIATSQYRDRPTLRQKEVFALIPQHDFRVFMFLSIEDLTRPTDHFRGQRSDQRPLLPGRTGTLSRSPNPSNRNPAKDALNDATSASHNDAASASHLEDAVTGACTRLSNPEFLERMLGVLALGEPMNPLVLSGLLGVDGQQLEELLQLPLVKQDEDGLRIADSSITSLLRDRLLLPPFSYAALSFGDAAAEQDGLLSHLFQAPPILDSILSGVTTIVIGERGAGKSAIHRRLAEGSESNEDTIVAAVKDHYEFLQHRLDDGDSQVSAEDFKAFWLLFKAIVVAKGMLTHGLLDGSPALRRDAIRMLRGFRLDGPFAARSRVERALHWVGGRFRAPIRLSVGPVVVDADISADLGARNIDVHQFLRSASDALTDLAVRLVIVVDQVDEVYKYEPDRQERAVQGLFLAEKFITEQLDSRLRTVILLRSDLFRLFNIKEKNKLVSRMHELVWEESALVEFILRRVLQNAELQRLRDLIPLSYVGETESSRLLLRAIFPSEVENVPFVYWLFRGLRNGEGRVTPRQVLLFLICAREEAMGSRGQVTGSPLFSEADASVALTRVSELSFGEVLDDYRVAATFVRNCKASGLSSFALRDVIGMFDRAEGEPTAQVESLERIGFLERRTNLDGEGGWWFHIPPLFTRHWGRVGT